MPGTYLPDGLAKITETRITPKHSSDEVNIRLGNQDIRKRLLDQDSNLEPSG
jgi:hypothetical protein